MKTLHYTVTVLLMLTCVFLAKSQQEDTGRITIEITKEVDGEKKTFKGEYSSREEMRADPNYQQFADEGLDVNSWMDSEENEQYALIEKLKEMGNPFSHFFDFEKDEDSDSFLFPSEEDSSLWSSYFEPKEWEKMREKFMDWKEEKGKYFHYFDFEQDKEGRRGKQIEISEVGSDFGKKGAVSKKNLLELDDLEFSLHPSSGGKFKVRFTTPSEGALRLHIYDEEGKTIFMRSFARFSGVYAESIDLSEQEQGRYLLEIVHEGKRLVKKIDIRE